MVTPTKNTATKTPKKVVDWDAITPDWKAGIKPKQHLAREYNVSRPAMEKHFGKLGIERDLGPSIQAKADALVARDAVAAELHATESDIVDANAAIQANVIRSHRGDIGRYRRLATSMMDELEAVTGEPLNLEALILAVGQDSPGVATQISKLAALPTRIKGLSELSTTLKTLVGLERQAFGIADVSDKDKTDKPISISMNMGGK